MFSEGDISGCRLLLPRTSVWTAMRCSHHRVAITGIAPEMSPPRRGALLYLLHSELKISLTPTGWTWQDPLRLFFLSECSAISPSWLSGPRFTPTSCSGSGKYGYPLDASTPSLITSCAPHAISWMLLVEILYLKWNNNI